MKAKEIINLCESEKLTNEEIFDLISSYFKKKFKSNGADMVLGTLPEMPAARVRVPVSVSKISVDFLDQYLSKLTYRLPTVSERTNSYGVLWSYIRFPYSFNSSNFDGSLFRLGVFGNKYLHQIDILVEFSLYFFSLYKEKKLSNYPEFEIESELRKVYLLIDQMVKNIRLES